MSENQEKKRVTSITRKLHWSFIGKKVKLYFGLDFLILLLMCGGFFVTEEYIVNDGIDFKDNWYLTYASDEEEAAGLNRYFCLQNEDGEFLTKNEIKELENKKDRKLVKQLTYVLKENSTGRKVALNIYKPIIWVLRITGGLLVFQFVGMIFSFYQEDRKIKKVLGPINEMAIQIDELSKLTMSEERYHEIEDALDQITPGENETLSLGNEDLKGIEAAMNNLVTRMRDSYRQQARFVNDASHELRTPITVIQGYVNMLDRWGKSDEKILGESIEAIKNETDHMQHLVEQLLFLARGDSGKTALNFEDFALNDMTKEVYEESLMIDENHIYRFKACDERIMVHADLGLLKQAFRILIDNAAKYTKSGDEIIISVGRNEEAAPYIQVQDTGIGMAEKDVANMFERFYRSDEVRNFQGTGLGLSIAKWIVDKHQGHFDILSRTELGTRIRIVL